MGLFCVSFLSSAFACLTPMSTSLVTPDGLVTYRIGSNQVVITLWALKGSRQFSQSTCCSREQARRHYKRTKARAL